LQQKRIKGFLSSYYYLRILNIAMHAHKDELHLLEGLRSQEAATNKITCKAVSGYIREGDLSILNCLSHYHYLIKCLLLVPVHIDPVETAHISYLTTHLNAAHNANYSNRSISSDKRLAHLDLWIFAGSIPNSEGKKRCHNLIEVCCCRLLASTLF
jgi:hypothetical protein